MVRMLRSLCRREDGWRKRRRKLRKRKILPSVGWVCPSNAAYFARAAAFSGVSSMVVFMFGRPLG
jgi:hypothetical protein